jgi:hypothetical protein
VTAIHCGIRSDSGVLSEGYEGVGAAEGLSEGPGHVVDLVFCDVDGGVSEDAGAWPANSAVIMGRPVTRSMLCMVVWRSQWALKPTSLAHATRSRMRSHNLSPLPKDVQYGSRGFVPSAWL